MTKEALRRHAKLLRAAVKDKADKDRAITERVRALDEYRKADALLCYASLSEEVATDALIESALRDGKRVALPRCEAGVGNMTFYEITDLTMLQPGARGIREPDPHRCRQFENASMPLVIVPGLCFDRFCHRLGYGGGYYDRFLKKQSFISVGLCYNNLIVERIPVNEYDRRVTLIVTEREIIRAAHTS